MPFFAVTARAHCDLSVTLSLSESRYNSSLASNAINDQKGDFHIWMMLLNNYFGSWLIQHKVVLSESDILIQWGLRFAQQKNRTQVCHLCMWSDLLAGSSLSQVRSLWSTLVVINTGAISACLQSRQQAHGIASVDRLHDKVVWSYSIPWTGCCNGNSSKCCICSKATQWSAFVFCGTDTVSGRPGM